MSSAAYLVNTLDIRKGSKECNMPNCHKIPTKEMILVETDLAKSKNRELGVVYLCSDHYPETSKKMLLDMNQMSKSGKIIDKKVFDIGYITY